jgi:hypothetical protein
MTDIVTIPDVLPISPYPALGSTNFNNEAYAYATSVPPAVSRMREIAVACWTNATSAQERANSATGSASAAAGSASAAAGSASGAAVVHRLLRVVRALRPPLQARPRPP